MKGLLEGVPDDPEALQALALTELKLGRAGRRLTAPGACRGRRRPRELIIAVTMAQAKLQQRDAKGAEEILKKAVEQLAQVRRCAYWCFRTFTSPKKKFGNRGGVEARARDRSEERARVDGNGKAATDPGAETRGGGEFQAVVCIRRLRNRLRSISFAGRPPDESIREFERLAEAHPDDRQIRTSLVAAYQGANRLDDAKKILGAVLKKNPNDLDALLQRGRTDAWNPETIRKPKRISARF